MSKRINKHAASRTGFTMVEMLIALTISAALMTATLAALDASFQQYKSTTESASTHVVSRIAMHRMLSMVRTGIEFGPFPADVYDTAQNPVVSDFIEFVSERDLTAGRDRITRIELRPGADPDGPGELWYVLIETNTNVDHDENDDDLGDNHGVDFDDDGDDHHGDGDNDHHGNGHGDDNDNDHHGDSHGDDDDNDHHEGDHEGNHDDEDHHEGDHEGDHNDDEHDEGDNHGGGGDESTVIDERLLIPGVENVVFTLRYNRQTYALDLATIDMTIAPNDSKDLRIGAVGDPAAPQTIRLVASAAPRQRR